MSHVLWLWLVIGLSNQALYTKLLRAKTIVKTLNAIMRIRIVLHFMLIFVAKCKSFQYQSMPDCNDLSHMEISG